MADLLDILELVIDDERRAGTDKGRLPLDLLSLNGSLNRLSGTSALLRHLLLLLPSFIHGLARVTFLSISVVYFKGIKKMVSYPEKCLLSSCYLIALRMKRAVVDAFATVTAKTTKSCCFTYL
jgi:hypothetical protein